MVRLAASFIVGVVVGASLLVAARGHDLQHFYEEVGQLRGQIENLQTKNDDLTQKLKKNSTIRRIRSVEIVIDTDDEITKLALQKQAKDLCKTLIGAKFSAVGDRPDLVGNLLDGRIITVESLNYKLHVKYVFINETDETVWFFLAAEKLVEKN